MMTVREYAKKELIKSKETVKVKEGNKPLGVYKLERTDDFRQLCLDWGNCVIDRVTTDGTLTIYIAGERREKLMYKGDNSVGISKTKKEAKDLIDGGYIHG